MPMRFRQFGAFAWMLVLVGLLVTQFFVPWRLDRLVSCLAILALIFKSARSHWTWLDLWLTKLWLCVLNVTTEWSFDVRLPLSEEEPPEAVSSRLESLLLRNYGETLRLDRRGPCDLWFEVDRQFSARTTVSTSDGTPVVSIGIGDMTIGFRDSVDRIDRYLVPFLKHMENLRPTPDGRKYCLVASFTDGNPYFEVFIQKLKINDVASFNLTIRSDAPDRVLSVKRDRVELTAKDLLTFRTHIVSIFRLQTGVA